MAGKRLLSLIKDASADLPDNQRFVNDLMHAIEQIRYKDNYKSSNFYKPSCLHCLRQMFFIRIRAKEDSLPVEYTTIGMAETGTSRHENIQKALMQMKDFGYDWEYVNVEEYVKMKQKQGKCCSLKIKGTKGAETHLIDENLKLSFRCDGIIRRISTNEYFLFEFKNVVSFKFNKIDKKVLDEHLNQVICYCVALDLDKVFLTYENRDVCSLDVPEVLEITDEMKENLINRLMECEDYVERQEVPPKEDSPKVCRYCQYKTVCKKY